MKKLILTATFFEAKPFLSFFHWEKIKRNFFECDNYLLHITGIGKKNVESFLREIKNIKTSEVLNIGLCGGVLNFKIGQSFSPDQVLTPNELLNNNINNSSLLLTLEKPMENPQEILQLFPAFPSHLMLGVDMESYYLKIFFEKKDIPIQFIKIFSDSGIHDFSLNFNDRKDFLQSALLNVAKKQYFNVV